VTPAVLIGGPGFATFAVFFAVLFSSALRLTRPPRQGACQTPAVLGLQAEDVEFLSRDSIPLRGWWIPSSHPRGTLLLSHGYSGDCSPDLQYANWLTGAGYNLLYFDHRGHGRSGGSFTTLGALETRDVLGALDWLKGRGIERVGALGFSMGGSVLLQAAPLTDAIRCVVADCTFGNMRSLLVHHAGEARIPPFLAPFASYLFIALVSLQTRTNLFSHTPEKSIGRIAPRPVLLIQAGSDELVPASETDKLYRAARQPVELWRVEGALHRAVDKVDRAEYERRITAFFDRYLAGTSERPETSTAQEARAEPLVQPAD
jgi:fermentation-respiration switch protein FrsA (DUF1100 family)